ncbi:bacillithiol biosynthesis cysteine-adding enzyme BshC [Thalassorhabdus alkalitolerans]|uniref:Putative cysteine ligase BshC n=1 Tax=Thalassorhabdus alkalitolerans TaxID=2282697 RepID=A0ABW0YQ69_9BACI|nr:bacillithiol biosynthesis cysteine-adding enzyme BshC [Thalassobacillus sp. C254]
MKIEEQNLPSSSLFVQKYRNRDPFVSSLFDYHYKDEDMKQRFMELTKRSFDRKALHTHLVNYQQTFTHNELALEQIDKLKDHRSVFVVGGQQAGILTGPFYTISKAVTLVLEAREQEEKLGIPVIPLFWIAGEDHDWHEVNHIFLPGMKGPRKHTYKGSYNPGQPVSEQRLNDEAFVTWMEEAVKSYRETPFTRKITGTITKLASRSSSMTHFFGELMQWLFKEEGLVLLDANHIEMRKLEREIFKKIVEENAELSSRLMKRISLYNTRGYDSPVKAQSDSAHFFYHTKFGRELLFRKGSGLFEGKKGQVQFTKEDIIQKIHHSPGKLSSNVATRPLVQEAVLPVLSFVAGPGEIKYWGLLQPLFHHLGYHMPPVLPRMHFSVVDRKGARILKEENLDPWKVIQHGTGKKREEVKKNAIEVDGISMAEEAVMKIKEIHAPLQEALSKVNPSHTSYGEKNYHIIVNEVKKLGEKITDLQEKKVQTSLHRLDFIEQTLFPAANPQERVWSIYPVLNEYGESFIRDICQSGITRNKNHKLIYL